jgi:hypothetical protein
MMKARARPRAVTESWPWNRMLAWALARMDGLSLWSRVRGSIEEDLMEFHLSSNSIVRRSEVLTEVQNCALRFRSSTDAFVLKVA